MEKHLCFKNSWHWPEALSIKIVVQMG